MDINEAGQLRIIGTQPFDAGEYKCEAVNEAGTDSASVTLEVGCKYSFYLFFRLRSFEM